jgi:hypothetical protein
MIPPSDPTGNLPPGVHEAEWDEFAERFGSTERRQKLLAGLSEVMALLADVDCPRVYVNGSFVTNKPEPEDFDACWELEGVNVVRLEQLESLLLRYADRRSAQKDTYGGELFPVFARQIGGGTGFMTFFQVDEFTGSPKGIVALDPRRLP